MLYCTNQGWRTDIEKTAETPSCIKSQYRNMPTLYVIAGPNGCGKSTLTRTEYFGNTFMIDPDAIARRQLDGDSIVAGKGGPGAKAGGPGIPANPSDRNHT